ncbi:hypothetical protein C8Q80DRAFT_1271163 [Daedaleopsis nitida]|nr:hypothetical protein C8Q80DRAFT_1271163 [Daedaleopsis nitida]
MESLPSGVDPTVTQPTAPIFDQEASDQEAVRVSQDIFILTYLLTGYRDGHSTSTVSNSRNALSLYTNLVFMLNIGHPTTDRAGNRVVAVAGCIDSNGLKMSTVVTRNHSVSSSEDIDSLAISTFQPGHCRIYSYPSAKLLVASIAPSPKPRKLLRSNETEYPKLHTHVQDVLALVRFCLASDPRKKEGLIANIFRFTWYQDSDNDAPGSRLTPEIFKIPSDRVDYLRSKYGLQPTGTTSPTDSAFLVSAENARKWCALLLGCLSYFEEIFKRQKIMPDLSSMVAANLYNTMGLLVCLLDVGVVEHLITDDLAKTFTKCYFSKAQSAKSTKSAATGESNASAAEHRQFDASAGEPGQSNPSAINPGQSNPSAINPGQSDDSAAGPDEDDNLEPDESSRSHVTRYLHTLVTPFNAARALAVLPDHLKMKPADVGMDLVIMNPTLPMITPDAVQESQDRVLATLSTPEDHEAIVKSFSALKNDPKLNLVHKKATVHAEAALMGVACGIAFGEIKCDFDAVDAMSVKLEQWGGQQASRRSYPSFVLPGTHASFFPWVPPIGIPPVVLVDMRITLSKILVESINKSKSTQTSPAMSIQSLPNSVLDPTNVVSYNADLDREIEEEEDNDDDDE